MIDALFNTTCQILTRQTTVTGQAAMDSWNKYQYAPGDDIPCIFINKEGKVVRDSKGEDVYISGIFVMAKPITEVDKILFDGYIYDIIPGGIIYDYDLISGRVDYYRITTVRRREYLENQITIS